ncbi:unnamed protein product [Rhizoctonia solani]|uniref:Phosphatidylinositol-specific phospholipase C X domain-containing protein n=1 Tax=Rhizoctonia solani TaxID=456999 RepID=A0A8H3HEU9_9AGAM|nr:unnamed protein product [Rhizoctonia solani]
MTTLHITNLTGSALPFTCSSPAESQWTHLDHETNVTTIVSEKGRRPRTYLFVRPASGPAYPVDEKATAKSFAHFPSVWVFKIRRPRALRSKEPWSVLNAICPHVPQSYPRIITDCDACRQDIPWNVYVVHAQDGSRVLFLPQRDMSMFLSETEDERPLSDVVLPGTHDSLAFYGWPVSQCQSPDQPLFKQLMSGIRVLDVRLSVVDGVLMAYHGAAPQRTSFSAILHTLHHFLQERPRECLVVSLKQEDYAYTSPKVFSRLVREEIERGEGGMAMWWLENRVPRLGEVRGRCIMLSRFGGDGKEWEHGLEGMGVHPTKWPDSQQDGFEWDLKGTTIRTHDWYRIPNLLALPEKASLCTQNMVPPISDPPAHEHADRAELLYARGDFEGAAEEHLRAANSYLQAIDACEDPAVKHSLRLMHEDHLKLSRDAQRAKQERTRQQQQQQGQQQPSPGRHYDLAATVTTDQTPRRMVDSTSSVEHTIEDSYMMLGGRPGEHNEAFDQFWKNLEGMLENLSQPVAFATAPLAGTSPGKKEAVDEDDGDESDASSNDSFCIIDSKDPLAPQTPKSAGFGSSAGSSPTSSKKFKNPSVPNPSLARSAYPPPPRIQQLETENAVLKADLERAIMRANTAERTLRQRAGQELALRESILSVRREAQRAMSATTAALRTTPSLGGPIPSRNQALVTSPSFAAPASPVVPPPPVKAQMAKYRERWEKLKESAKRKRAAKGQSETSSAANVTIPEEQEPEAEQPDAGQETPATPVATGSGLNSHSVLRSPESIVASH